MAKNRVIIKIVILIAILTYLLLGGPLVVLGNTTEEKVTNNIRNNITNYLLNLMKQYWRTGNSIYYPQNTYQQNL